MGKLTVSSGTKTSDSRPPFVIGIDLGTTNSLMAIAGFEDSIKHLPPVRDSGEISSSLSEFVPVRVLQLPQRNLDGTVASHDLFPSVVFQESSNGERFFGMGAREAKFAFARGRSVFYSVKLDLGTDRDPFYPSAVSPDLNTPVKVSAEILRSMKNAAEAILGRSLAGIPVIITIPACFQAPQRRDTLLAARMAGFDVGGNCLFDEPCAALLAHMNRRRVQQRWSPEETVLVFDFGGGTCDISIIDVSWTPSSQKINLKSLAISRFEQLGGDDIDKHLVHSLLKEEFYRVSGRKEREWGFGERQRQIWSQLAKIAELLKVRFCQELDKVVQASGWTDAAVRSVAIGLPSQVVRTSQGEVRLDRLSLNWDQFKSVMSPFLDPGSKQDEVREYYRLTSIFTPICDALDKANLKRKDITRILLAGGSSYNPLVEKAIQDFFPEATIERPEKMDYLVAEGAALHAYWHFVIGHDLLAAIAGDTLGLLTEGGVFIPLIPAGAPIPFPADGGLMTYDQFRIPRSNMSHVDLVFCAGSASRPILPVELRLSRGIPVGSPVHLRIGLDGNKIFTMEAFLPDYPEVRVIERIDNPLGLLPMTSHERARKELEKTLTRAQAEGTLDQHVEEMERLANVLLEMERSEPALDWIGRADRSRGKSTPASRQLRARAHFELGEYKEAHNLYAELSNLQPADWVSAYMASVTAGDLAAREFFMKRAASAAPGNGVAQYGLGQVLFDKGDSRGAREAFTRARDAFEAGRAHGLASRNSLFWLASTYEALGEPGKAAQVRRQAEMIQADKTETSLDMTHLVGLSHPIVKA